MIMNIQVEEMKICSKCKIEKPKYDFKRSDITRMPKEEYQQKLPAIVKAFQTGRVLDD